MKKILSATVCLLLLLALATPVFAAQTAKMTVTASDTELKPGDTVTFTVAVSKVENATMGGFRFVYDESVFEYKEGKSRSILDGYMAGVTTAANKVAGFFMSGKETIEGDLFTVTFKVREDAKAGAYSVTGKPSLTADGVKLDCTAVEARVTVGTGGAEDDTATKPTEPKPTVPDVSAPSVPAMPAEPDTPEDSVPPQTDDTHVGTGAIIHGTGPTEENQHLEQDPQKPAFPWWIVAVIVLVAAGAAVFLIFESKKTKNTQ